ncbi:hypothetical protein [Desulfomonile tiedjei]|uniref:Uncharacterized protein n=1 Tax=Desulfomonile tiedjei (strain ATCC 49306 / DSM 6799 / DCB-1) TaxID=706587 RepID=I4C615_DESTA|nr:hypothetical protein [Desulfomonile tiedjei]AFM25006.1 hypothetical protein Desti_2319 [Desulfomonile tiedjei DSM 6799]
MKHIEILQKLAKSASREEYPQVDVSRTVMAAILQTEEPDMKPLLWIAGVASACALTACVLGVQAWDPWVDPSLINPFSLVAWVIL